MEKQKSETGRQLVELRRSGAAGIHGKRRKDRRNKRREAIEFSRREA